MLWKKPVELCARAALVIVMASLLPACSAPPARGSTTRLVEKRTSPKTGALSPTLEAAFARWEQAGPTGDEEHRARLRQLASVVREQLAATGRVDLVFVCTHNSRRSHMAQLLGLAAARRNGLDSVRTFSGGTEATAFNPRAIGALRRVGFEIAGDASLPNPRYSVRFGPSAEGVEAFSKRFSDPPNPEAGFVAVMTCSQADAACPFVPGAVARLAVPYEDPKVADGTPDEAAKYDERVEQIGRDLAWVFGGGAGALHR